MQHAAEISLYPHGNWKAHKRKVIMNIVVANTSSGAGSLASKVHLEQRLKEALNEKEITEVSVRVQCVMDAWCNVKP